MLAAIYKHAHRIARFFSRAEILIRLFGLSRHTEARDKPGLVMIQIDGLSQTQLKHALEKKRMPFLKSLLEKQNYRLRSHYPGVPSTTPAVQGELFFGVRQAVPSFSFFDWEKGYPVRMLDPEKVWRIEEEITGRSRGLLRDGSAYCDIYNGGADESHFCVSGMSLQGFMRHRYSFRFVLLILLHFISILRIVLLLGLEFILALWDVMRGVIDGKDLLHELQFIPSRVGTCILLRELSVIGGRIDIARGLPIVHINFLGYDEQSHRRGPSSLFAHWSLRGIDDAVKRLYKAARQSPWRHFDVWVYSDHGQAKTTPFKNHAGRSLHHAVAEVLGDDLNHRLAGPARDNVFMGLNKKKFREKNLHLQQPESLFPNKPYILTAMGPVGHIYFRDRPDPGLLSQYARRLVDEARVPMVLLPVGSRRAAAFTPEGTFDLPEQGQTLFAEHPCRREVVQDIVELCHLSNSGDLILSGWSRTGDLVSFPVENGSHGGPGIEETNAFCLLPPDVHVDDAKGYLRPYDLREAVLRFLYPDEHPRPLAPYITTAEPDILRVMTYNVHRCLGMDGRISPHRIARVIARFNPDIVALQEIDNNRPRTENLDQAALIAEYLNMNYHFFPAIRMREEEYGNAVLSRHPIEIRRVCALPRPGNHPWLETRGALVVDVSFNGRTLCVLNTHLGLTAREKALQTEYILNDGFLPHDSALPVILCGDYNFTPHSPFFRRIARDFRDVQAAPNRPGMFTWPCRYPFVRLDHIFTTGHFQVESVLAPRNDLTQTASDHLPLIADLRLIE